MNLPLLKHFFRDQKSLFLLLLAATFVFGISILSGNYYHMPCDNIKDGIFIFFHWSILSIGYCAIIYLLVLNKYIFSFLFPIINIIFASLIYYIVQLDISVNPVLIELILNTNKEEGLGLISLNFAIYIGLIILLSMVFVHVRRKKIKIKYHLFHTISIFFLALIPFSVNKIRHDTISQRVPFSIYSSVVEYIKEQKLLKQNRKDISQHSVCKADTLTVVLVLGEALRADHLSINGYKKKTCPNLEQKKIISFTKIFSEWTHTNKSIPHILTRADSSNYLPAYNEKSLVSIFKKCNFDTYWLGNQEAGSSFSFIIKECNNSFINKPLHTVYNYTKKLDADLLPHYEKYINQANPLKFIIVHLIGSHWYYPSHYPSDFEIFKPTITGKTFSQRDSIKIVNAYDNTILYTDYIVNELITKIEKQNSILLFLSDHGELLGEEGKWLHAQNTKYEKNPAFFMWFSEKFKQKNEEKIKNAELSKNNHWRTDFLFHSILDISEIENPLINSKLNIFDQKDNQKK